MAQWKSVPFGIKLTLAILIGAPLLVGATQWIIHKDHKLYQALAKSRAERDPNRRISFGDYCKQWRTWESANCFDEITWMVYCDSTYGVAGTWSVAAARVDASKYAGGSLAVVILDGGGENKPPPISAAVVTDPDFPGTYSVLLPGNFPWGEEVTTKTVVYLPTPQLPERWCRVWPTGARMVVLQDQSYTLIQTAEEIIPNGSAQPAGLLLPHQRENRIIPNSKCSMFGFPHSRKELERVDAKVVECGAALKSISDANMMPPPGSYFCGELDQRSAFVYDDSVGWRFEGPWFSEWHRDPWDLPKERRWPIFCQNWTTSNRVDVDGDGDGAYLLAGFLRHLNVTNERALAVFAHFNFQS